jgi:hypothetical protein
VNPVDSGCSRPDTIAKTEILSIAPVIEIPPTSNDEADPIIRSIPSNDEPDPTVLYIPPHNDDDRRRLRLRNRRRAGIDLLGIDEDEMQEGRKHSKNKEPSDVYPTENALVSYQCQYGVTNTGSSDVTVTVDGTPSIDLGTIGASNSNTFLLDYDVATGACPSVTVTAASNKDCGEISVSWSPPTPIK